MQIEIRYIENMDTSSNRKKKFVVLAAIDEKSPIASFTTVADTHYVACHQVEITHGWGSFIALNKNQAQQVYRDLKNRLQDW